MIFCYSLHIIMVYKSSDTPKAFLIRIKSVFSKISTDLFKDV